MKGWLLPPAAVVSRTESRFKISKFQTAHGRLHEHGGTGMDRDAMGESSAVVASVAAGGKTSSSVAWKSESYVWADHEVGLLTCGRHEVGAGRV